MDKIRCAVVGGGPTGLAAAMALAKMGLEVALIPGAPRGGPGAAGPRAGAPSPTQDPRTAALFPASMRLLENLGAGPAITAESAPLSGIRLVDDTGFLLRAPEVLFEAREIGLDSFGRNVPNDALVRALARQVKESPQVQVLEGAVATAIELSDACARLTLADGTVIAAQIVVAADGRQSICRTAAGIGVRSWTYDQAAIATRFEHDRSHQGVSTEFHRRSGPCTVVPLPGNASSLVWVESKREAERLMGLGDEPFIVALEARLAGLLGPIRRLGPRRSFPLSALRAERMAARRVALVGEAGHVIPPIGAQGLNLGLRDVAVLADCLAAARSARGDADVAEALDSFDRARRSDVATRIGAVDALNRSLTSGLVPFDLARGLGLHLLSAVPALRHAVMREGLQPSGPLPRLMQPT